MGFHKHRVYSFTVEVQRMSLIGGDNFVADITALRRHRPNGTGITLELPAMPEQYGETSREAEGRAVIEMARWLDCHQPLAADRRETDSPHISADVW